MYWFLNGQQSSIFTIQATVGQRRCLPEIREGGPPWLRAPYVYKGRRRSGVLPEEALRSMVGGRPTEGSETHPCAAGLENSSLVTVVELWGAWSGGFQLAAGMRLYI